MSVDRADVKPPRSGARETPHAAEGLLLVDKPEGPTSHDIVQAVRKAVGISRAGHAGTLDPFASGLLVVGLGRATRLLRFLSAADKVYEGTIRLGVRTDTDDLTGRPLGEPRPVGFREADLAEASGRLTGAFEQLPPVYSARKHLGVPHYRLARKGHEAPRRPVVVRVRWHELRRVDSETLFLRVTVSAGTYIRALARDLGEALGCGGHLVSLRRVASGDLRVEEALAFPRPVEEMKDAVRPVEAIPLGLPTITLGPEERSRVGSGAAVPAPESSPSIENGGWVRLLDGTGAFVGLAEIDPQHPEDGSEEPRRPLLRPRLVW